MLKKAITFKTLDGKSVTQDFWFNLSKAEIATMEMTANGGSMSKLLLDIVKNQDPAGIISTFELFITKSYGIRGEDNQRFIKSADISESFKQTDAYSELFMELVTNAEEAAKFIEGIVPPEVKDHLTKESTFPKVVDDLKLPELDHPFAIQPGENAPFRDLPPAGDGPAIEFGPFKGLTENQLNGMSRDEQFTYISDPESFRK